MSRDYFGEMRALIDAEATGSYVPASLANELVEKLRVNDPDLLAGWLDGQAENFLRQAINARDNSQRSAARHARPRSVFASAAKAAEVGEPEQLARWLDVRFTVEDGSRTPLREMTKDQLLFAGDAYQARADENRMTSAFLKAIARKVGTAKVADKFSDEQLTAMWDSLTGR